MTRKSAFKCWIEAMRLRTLPVSVSGVLAGAAAGLYYDVFRWEPVVLCLVFAVLAQIASNFANEYFDFRDGLDKVGREGPRRGVTEGDITPQAMLRATFVTLGLAAAVGCSLIWWGGWWLLGAGAVIVVGALAYSAGPYPLSRHGLGEVAVILFFGIVPVVLTYYVQAPGAVPAPVWCLGAGIGLLGANVLIVNNYRDIEDDRAVGKRTLAVKLGARAMLRLYLLNGLFGLALTAPLWPHRISSGIRLAIFAYIIYYISHKLGQLKGAAINPWLGRTALVMLVYTLLLLLFAAGEALTR